MGNRSSSTFSGGVRRDSQHQHVDLASLSANCPGLLPEDASRMYQIFRRSLLPGTSSLDFESFLRLSELNETSFVTFLFEQMLRRSSDGDQEEGDGVDARAFVLLTYDFCVTPKESLPHYLFEVFSNGREVMDIRAVTRMLKHLYQPKSQFDKHGKTILKTLRKKYDGGRLNRAQFFRFALSNSTMLFPAFQLHRSMRKNVLGKKAWKRIYRLRCQREKKKKKERGRKSAVDPPTIPPNVPGIRPVRDAVAATLSGKSAVHLATPPKVPAITPVRTVSTPSHPGSESSGYVLSSAKASEDMRTPPQPPPCHTLTFSNIRDDARLSPFARDRVESDDSGRGFQVKMTTPSQRSVDPVKDDHVVNMGVGVGKIVGTNVNVIRAHDAPDGPIIRTCEECFASCNSDDGGEDENGSWYCRACWVRYSEGQ